MRSDHVVGTRPARAEDAVAIATVHAMSWRETYGRFVDDHEKSDRFAVDRRVDMWRSLLERGVPTTVVATIGDAVVGFASVQAVSPSTVPLDG